MTEPTTTPETPAPAAGCCATATAAPASTEAGGTTAAPCCGTAQGATGAGACCDPAAKREAVTAGTGCC
ncbi:hypothetical protein ACWEQL_33360 [Kitasatospora sp. NPDC004240]